MIRFNTLNDHFDSSVSKHLGQIDIPRLDSAFSYFIFFYSVNFCTSKKVISRLFPPLTKQEGTLVIFWWMMYNSVCVHHASRAFYDILLIFNFFIFFSLAIQPHARKCLCERKDLRGFCQKRCDRIQWLLERRKKKCDVFLWFSLKDGQWNIILCLSRLQIFGLQSGLKHRVLRKVFKVKFLKVCEKIAELVPIPSFFQRSGFPNICKLIVE